MPRALSSRRLPRRHIALQRQAQRRGRGSQPVRLSDLVLALLGVVLLAGFALVAAYALTRGVGV
jgi:hypothetical protein